MSRLSNSRWATPEVSSTLSPKPFAKNTSTIAPMNKTVTGAIITPNTAPVIEAVPAKTSSLERNDPWASVPKANLPPPSMVSTSKWSFDQSLPPLSPLASSTAKELVPSCDTHSLNAITSNKTVSQALRTDFDLEQGNCEPLEPMSRSLFELEQASEGDMDEDQDDIGPGDPVVIQYPLGKDGPWVSAAVYVSRDKRTASARFPGHHRRQGDLIKSVSEIGQEISVFMEREQARLSMKE